MPQKKRTATKKRTSSKRKSKKTKVYIPANSIISLCAIVVGVCTALLLTSTILTGKNKESTVPEPVVKAAPAVPQKKPPEKVEKNQTVSKPKTQAQEKAAASAKQEHQTSRTEKVAVPEAAATVPAVTAVSKAVEPVVVTPAKPVSDIPDFPYAANGAKLVIIFDDGGQNMNQLEKCITLPFPVTVAVLPGLIHSKEAANRVRSSGNEVMLHQPMQSVRLDINPGAGAITPDMNEDQIKSVLFNNILEVGPVAGINNHEGSLITADAEKMAAVMKVCSDQGVYFLDSRTNADTKVPFVASALGYSYYERNIFLDNERSRANYLKELSKGVAVANKTGTAIMIGHVWSGDTLPAVLHEVYPVLKEKGYTFTSVSKCGALKSN